MQKASFEQPTDMRQFPHGTLELVQIGTDSFGRTRFEPGWKWSNDVKPTAHTDSCQMSHVNFHLAGRLHVRMDDGAEQEFGPGDISIVPPGHDAWVVGDEAVVAIDISGMKHYAEEAK